MERTTGSAESEKVLPAPRMRGQKAHAPSRGLASRSIPAAAIVLTLGTSCIASHAADLPTPTSIGPKFETLGVQTGQTPDQVRSALLKVDPNGTWQESKSEDRATGQSYTSRLVFSSNQQNPEHPALTDATDSVAVLFSGPASGNRSIGVVRTVNYRYEARPVRADTVLAFEQKYGRPPNYGFAPGLLGNGPNPNVVDRVFVFAKDGKVRSPDPKANLAACNFNAMASLTFYTTDCSSAAFAYSINTDKDRVQFYTVMIKDADFAFASRKLEDEAAKDAVQKKHDADIERLKQTGGAAPRL